MSQPPSRPAEPPEDRHEERSGEAGKPIATPPSGSPAKKSNGKKIVFAFVIVLLICIAGGYFYWNEYLRGYVSTDDAYIDAYRLAVNAKILGRIVQLNAEEGDTVQQGQLLVQLDDTDFLAQKAQVEANIAYAHQNVRLAEVSLALAKDDFKRATVQYRDKIITQETYDHEKKALERAQAQLDIALAQVKTAEVQLDVIMNQLDNTRIVAPSKGVIARRWLLPGEVVQPGQPVFTLYDTDSVWVTINLEETKISSIDVGDPAKISVDAYHGRDFEGKVLLIGAAAASQFSLIPPNNASGNFTKVTQRIPIKISIQDLNDRKGGQSVALLPGMSVIVKIKVN